MQQAKNVFGLQETINCFFLSKKIKCSEMLFTHLPHEFFEEFRIIACKICELDALTFKSEETKEHLDSLNMAIKPYIQVLNDKLEKPAINDQEWRLILGLYCCFMEWCEEVGYFDSTPEEQRFLLSENPLTSFPLFLS